MAKISPVVERVGKLHIDGNIIPHSWYASELLQNPSGIEGKAGKPNLVAIILLSDVLYWYRPTEIRDEYTSAFIERKQKFAADKLQKNYEKWGEQFGFTKRQVEDAMSFLQARGLVTVEKRAVQTEFGKLPNVAFIEPVMDAIEPITVSAMRKTSGKTGEAFRKNGRRLDEKTPPPARKNGEITPKKRETITGTSSGTLLENPAETTAVTSLEIPEHLVAVVSELRSWGISEKDAIHLALDEGEHICRNAMETVKKKTKVIDKAGWIISAVNNRWVLGKIPREWKLGSAPEIDGAVRKYGVEAVLQELKRRQHETAVQGNPLAARQLAIIEIMQQGSSAAEAMQRVGGIK